MKIKGRGLLLRERVSCGQTRLPAHGRGQVPLEDEARRNLAVRARHGMLTTFPAPAPALLAKVGGELAHRIRSYATGPPVPSPQ